MKKAQAAIMGLIFAFMLVIIMAILQEPLLAFIAIGVNASFNVTNGDLMITIIEIIPVMFWLVVFIAIVALITGSQR